MIPYYKNRRLAESFQVAKCHKNKSLRLLLLRITYDICRVSVFRPDALRKAFPDPSPRRVRIPPQRYGTRSVSAPTFFVTLRASMYSARNFALFLLVPNISLIWTNVIRLSFSKCARIFASTSSI